MVDGISGKMDSLPEAGLLNVNTQQGTEKIGGNANQAAEKAIPTNLLDEAAISDEARQAYEVEKEAIRFSRMAQRGKETIDTDKVTHFKDLLDNGRINDYLRSLNTEALADSLLSSSSGPFLKNA